MEAMMKRHKVGRIVTPWRTFRGGRYRIRAEYGFLSMNGPGRDHFGITGETERFSGGAWREDSGGCIHDMIATHFPELAPMIRWHGTMEDGPTHYAANGMFWWDRIGLPKERPYDPDAAAAFRETVVWRDSDAATYPGDPIHDAPLVRVLGPRTAFDGMVFDGAAESLRHPPEVGARREAVKVWLAGRLPGLMVEFWADMARFGLMN